MELLTRVTLPAIAPQVTLRCESGRSGLAGRGCSGDDAGRDGRGFAIWNAPMVANGPAGRRMSVIGVIGVVIDRGAHQDNEDSQCQMGI